VSSILNALKKVESESAQPDKAQLSSGRRIDAKRVIRSQHRESGLRGKILLFVMPALTLAVALWVAFQYGPFTISKASTAPTTLSEPERQEATQKEEIRENPEKRKQFNPAQPNYAREKNSPSKTAAEKENPTTVPAKTPPTREEGPPIEGPELKLQAIVWSYSPDNCFAVINGVIVRVGGKVEGVSVTEIGTDFVSFKSGQRTWKMKMMTE
jgi:hypothetical protein